MPLALDAMGRRYQRLPSEIARLTAWEFTFNWICMMAGHAEDERIIEQVARKSPLGVVPVVKLGGR